jgi:hypothetical protein
VDEDVLVTSLRLDEPVTLRRIEPLDGAFLHVGLLQSQVNDDAMSSLHAAPQAVFWMIRFLAHQSGEQPERQNPIA